MHVNMSHANTNWSFIILFIFSPLTHILILTIISTAVNNCMI